MYSPGLLRYERVHQRQVLLAEPLSSMPNFLGGIRGESSCKFRIAVDRDNSPDEVHFILGAEITYLGIIEKTAFDFSPACDYWHTNCHELWNLCASGFISERITRAFRHYSNVAIGHPINEDFCRHNVEKLNCFSKAQLPGEIL